MQAEPRKLLFSTWPGCTDGYCIVRGKAQGMHTNGGCRCLVNATRAQLQMLQGRLSVLLNELEKDNAG